MTLLDQINSPSDLKELTQIELGELADDIRKKIIHTTSKNGGHVGPNLGVVELTLALHRVFNSPNDSFIFDVGHQGYVHKLITGRNNEKFDNIRKTNGLSGFLSIEESLHDSFGAGHAGTALSAALGMAAARDLNKSRSEIVAICGDASFTCGVTLEALNNIQDSTKKIIIILNDNKWSISQNVGALPKYFNDLITNPIYNTLNEQILKILNKIIYGKKIIKIISNWKKETKNLIVSSSIFEKFGVRYIGPIDGHNINELERYLKFAKGSKKPILLHVITTKGKNYDVALKNPEKFHGTSAYDIKTGESKYSHKKKAMNFQDVLGKTIVKVAQENCKIIGITAAMPSGTGLNYLKEKLPKQFYDVGIAEEHAVLFAAGMASKGYRPICAIYSTFLQRAYDQIIHDVALQNLPVVFCLDRAGLSPNDGPTHHGLFDISYLRPIPNCVVMAPTSDDELADMLLTALDYQGPVFIRYPRGEAKEDGLKEKPKKIGIGKAVRIKEAIDIDIWAIGSSLEMGKQLASRLSEFNIIAGLVNPRFAKPLDRNSLIDSCKRSKLIVTIEDNVLKGGFGSAILESIQDFKYTAKVLRFGWPDRFIEHATSDKELKEKYSLDIESITKDVIDKFNEIENSNKNKRFI